MAQDPAPAPGLVRWWEGLSTGVQAAIAFPALFVLFGVLNLGLFNQPLWRSILYGVIEGGVFGGLLLWATATERGKRQGRGRVPPK
ncbi:MAG: hypothetical protein M3024_02465 [Candidatus Dormibacteraeota bacterium]|nr:hypothetical protein [Candidatus Dormibacteraeota bacterium]